MKIAFVFLFGILSIWGRSQQIADPYTDCIQLLDSAEYYSESHPAKAEYYARSLLTVLDSGQCDPAIGYPEIYNNTGLVLWHLNKKDEALQAMQQSLDLALSQTDSLSRDLTETYFNISAFYQETLQLDKSRTFLALALKTIEMHEGPNSPEYLNALYRSGLLQKEQGRFNDSEQSFDKALALHHTLRLNNDSIQAKILNELGTLYRILGQFEKSEKALNQTLQLYEGEKSRVRLEAIDRLSSLHLDEADFSESESKLLENLNEKKALFPNDTLLLAQSYNNLGVLYFRIHDYENAELYFKKVLTFTDRYEFFAPHAYNNLGIIYMRNGHLDLAEENFKKSGVYFRETNGGIHPDYASSINNLAGLYKKKGELQKALDLYMKVLDLDRVIYGKGHQNYASTLNNIANIYLQTGYASLAGSFLKIALRIRTKTLGAQHPLCIKNLNDIGIYHLFVGDTTQALVYLDSALQIEIGHINNVFSVLTERQRLLFFNDTKFAIERFVSLSFSKNYINTEWALKALDYYINTKSILFYAADKLRNAVRNSNDQRSIQLFKNWQQTKYQLAHTYLLNEEEKKRKGLSIADLEKLSDRYEKELSLLHKSFSINTQRSFISWKEIAQSLGEDEAFVDIIQFREFSLSRTEIGFDQGFEDDSKYAAFVIRKGQTKPYVKIWNTSERLERYLSNYQNSVKYGIRDTTSYAVFWKEIDLKLRDVQTVFYTPDGIFHSINPAQLYNLQSGQYIIDKYDVVNMTSGKDLLKDDQHLVHRNITLVGNANFRNTKPDLVPLPGTASEIESIQSHLKIHQWKTKIFAQDSASEQLLKFLKAPAILHVATHGFFDENEAHENPLLNSGIYLSKSPQDFEDGILSAYEAMNLQLEGTNLVVLSACETGLGKVKNGEGVYGLQRAFLVAGAENLILSLNKVDDAITRDFMVEFYENLNQSENIAEAFHETILHIKSIHESPYYWGSFVLVSR